MLINQNSSTTSFTVCLLLDCPVCQRCLRSTLVPSSACPECGCSTGTQPQSTVTSHRRWSNSIAYQYSTTSGAVLMHRILLCQCPPYLVDLLTFTPNIIHWHRLRLSTARAAIIQRVRTVGTSFLCIWSCNMELCPINSAFHWLSSTFLVRIQNSFFWVSF